MPDPAPHAILGSVGSGVQAALRAIADLLSADQEPK